MPIRAVCFDVGETLIDETRHWGEWADFHASDLYPDAIPCLATLKSRGLKVLIAGNQPIEAEAALARLQIPTDLIATSAGWGVSKPDPAFFERVIDVAGESPDS